ncbi:MAG: PDZ domain-containing protein [Nanoarchaeota archaeon]
MKLGLRIWILIIVLLLSLLSISPWKAFEKGVLIKSVEANSSAFDQGLRSGQIITSIDGTTVNNLQDFSDVLSEKNYSKDSIKTVVSTKQGEFILFSNKSPEITVSAIPKSNIKTGLDLSGGSRALVKAKDKELSSSEVSNLIDIVSNRLNVYGILDVQISPVSDLSGNNFMMVEIAGATTTDLKGLLSSQGKFEAKIGNETVFIGGEKDIADVARGGQDAFVECPSTFNGFCNFRFTIFLSPEAAQRHADITKNLTVDTTDPQYLSKKLDLYLDDNLVDSLFIGKDLQGRVTTQVSISGPGSGSTQDEAYKDAQNSMKKLQTILITGSLPYQLEIVKLDTISPSLGESFTKNIILLGLIVFLIISVILFIKYRKIKITLSVILTMFSEAFITVGIAAFISQNLDAPAIAGIIAGMGTGVNDQIVILDESIFNKQISLKERIKKALFIILGAFFTIVVAMLPLLWAGAGMLKGFALTTIISVTAGILITRPAFAEIIRRIGE